MCYYNGQKVTRAEFIKLKSLEKAVSKYNFLNIGVHNGFNYAPCAILVPTEDGKDFEIVQAEWGYVPIDERQRNDRSSYPGLIIWINNCNRHIAVQ